MNPRLNPRNTVGIINSCCVLDLAIWPRTNFSVELIDALGVCGKVMLSRKIEVIAMAKHPRPTQNPVKMNS